MDNLTHSLVGIALSRAFFKNKAPLATTMLVLAANAPDLDVLVAWRGIDYLAWHRNLTHSLLFLPVWMLIIALLWRWLSRSRLRRGQTWIPELGEWRNAPEKQVMQSLGAKVAHPGRLPENPVTWRLGLLAGFLGVGSHLLLDWTNSYGIRLFSPLNSHWFALDWMPIVDPWLWLILAAFLLLPMVLGLVGREMGARKSAHRASAYAALVAMFFWWGLRADMHARAVHFTAQSILPGEAARNTAAIPEIFSPFLWRGIVSLPGRYYVGSVQALTLQWRRQPRVLYKPASMPAIQAAEQSRDGRIFLNFSRFPYVRVRRGRRRTEVILSDLRFGSGMGLRLWLNSKLQVEKTAFGFGTPAARPGR